MNKFIHVRRKHGDDKHTLGVCEVIGTDLTNDLITKDAVKIEGWAERLVPLFTSISLERGWLDNKPNVSCIPTGVYDCVFEHSPRFDRKLWEIYGVDGRTETKFHSANYSRSLNGCLALGRIALHLDGDNTYDITRSRETMRDFHDVLRDMEGKIVKLIVE